MFREFDPKGQRYQCVRGPHRAYYGVILRKFPVNSLFNREFGGDGFAADCLHHHPLSSEPRSMNARGGNAAVPGRLAGILPTTVAGRRTKSRFSGHIRRPSLRADFLTPVFADVVNGFVPVYRPNPSSLRCSSQEAGNQQAQPINGGAGSLQRTRLRRIPC